MPALQPHPPDLWAAARRLVVEQGYSFTRAAQETGISLSSIEKRAAREKWTGERAKSLAYSAGIRLLKSSLLDAAREAAESGNVDEAYKATQAWRQAESAYPEHRYTPPTEDKASRLKVELETLERLVAYAQKTDRTLLAALQAHLRPFAAQLEAASNG